MRTFLVILFIIFVVLPLLGRFLLYAWVGSVRRNIRRQQNFAGADRNAESERAHEGEVKIVQDPVSGHKKVNKRVGDYVDYEEIKEK